MALVPRPSTLEASSLVVYGFIGLIPPKNKKSRVSD